MSIPTDAPPTSEQGYDTGYPLTLLGIEGRSGAGAVFTTPEPEYVEALRYPFSNVVFDRMQHDAKIAEVLRGIIGPIVRAPVALDGSECRPQVVEHVARDLGVRVLGDTPIDGTKGRKRGRFSLSEHKRLSLETALVFGHAPFEQVADVRPDGPGGSLAAHLVKLAPRFPNTIERIEVARDGGLVAIRQHPGPATNLQVGEPPIGVDRLVFYSYDRKGAAWQGRSVLRSAYRPWLLKDEGLRDWPTVMRRNGMGIPTYNAPEGASKQQITDGATLAQGARGGPMSGIGLPAGAKFSLTGVSGALPSYHEFVTAMNVEIAGSLLAEVLKLGDTGHGSQALATPLVDLWMSFVESVDDWWTAIFNAHVIEDLVDWTYGEDEPAPTLVTTERVGQDAQAVAGALSGLVTAGLITPDAPLEDYVRRAYRVPERDPATARPAALPPAPVPVAASAGGDPRDPHGPRQHRAAADGETGPVGAGGRHLRPLTTVEAASGLDPASMDEDFAATLTSLVGAWASVQAGQVDAILARLSDVLASGDLSRLADLDVATGLGVDALVAAMTQLAGLAGDAAAREANSQGGAVITAADVDALASQIRARATAIDDLLASGLASAAARSALQHVGAGPVDADAVTAAVRDHLEGLSGAYVQDQLTGGLMGAQNDARIATWEPIADGSSVYASELLDGNTCPPCAAIDGHYFASMTEATTAYPTGGYAECRGGPRCRGTLVLVRNEAAPTT